MLVKASYTTIAIRLFGLGYKYRNYSVSITVKNRNVRKKLIFVFIMSNYAIKCHICTQIHQSTKIINPNKPKTQPPLNNLYSTIARAHFFEFNLCGNPFF